MEKASGIVKVVLALFSLVILGWVFMPNYTKEAVQTQPTHSGPDGVRHLRFGHNFQVSTALHAAAEKFAETVRAETDGRVDVTIYPEQKLGTDDQMIEMVRDGTLDILVIPTAKLSAAVPALQYADLPFFFRDRPEAYRMLDGEPGRMILDRLTAIGLVGVTFWENGFKHFTANRPIHEPEDLRGLKMRVMKSRILMDQFQAFGAQPVTIDFYSTQQALRDGVVDGQENPLSAIVMMEFYKAQKHVTLSSHGYLSYVFVISQKVYQSLPNDIGTLLLEIARRITPYERTETQQREAAFLQTIRQAGLPVYELTEQQRSRFAALTAHIPHQFEPVIGADVLSKTEELMREQRLGAVTDPDILIGLDADLSGGAARAGLAIKRGVQIAVDEINERGGVLGRKLALIARDDHMQPERGSRNIHDFAARPNLVAILAGSSSNVVLGEVEAAQQRKIPLLVPWATSEGIVENGYSPNFVFRLSVSDREGSPFLIAHALTNHQKPALLLNNREWGRENFASLTRALSQRGTAPVIVEWFNGGEQNFAAHLSHIESAKADVVIMVASPSESTTIINAMANRPHPLPIVSHWGASLGNIRDEMPAVLDKIDLTFIQTFSFLGEQSLKTKSVIQRYTESFDIASANDIFVPVGTAHAYDLIHLLAQAISAAGSTDREAVRTALEHIESYDGLVKTYHQPFTPARHEALSASDYLLCRYGPNGTIVPIKSANSTHP